MQTSWGLQMTVAQKPDPIGSGDELADAGDQQHTGNHDRPAREKLGNEKLGGTRAGAENVEPKQSEKS